jgi:GPH family glycoside/pentoside/hexuronide:cation symporter
MTTMLGVPAWLAGVAILVPKIWLIACDPLMGAWSDRHAARSGRTPFLALGGVLAGLGFALLFLFTRFPNPTIAAAVIGGLFLIGSTAFSAFSVPYLAVASELSTDPGERTKILAFRMVFTIVGSILGVGLAQPLIFHFGGKAAGWRIMGWCYGLVCLVTMLSSALGLRGIRTIARGAARTHRGLREQLTTAWRNRPFVIVTAGSFLMSVSQATSYAVISFIYLYAARDVALMLPFVLAMCVGNAVSQPLWVALSRRIGKYRCFVIASLGWALVTLTWLYLRPGGPIVADLPIFGPLPLQHALVLVRGLIIGVNNAGFVLMAFSMLTDTIDQQRRTFGFADEGVFSGIYSAVEKFSFAVGPLIAGSVLSLSGFVSSTTGVIPQSASAIRGILLLYSVIPVAIQLLSLWVFARYPAAAGRGDASAESRVRKSG